MSKRFATFSAMVPTALLLVCGVVNGASPLETVDRTIKVEPRYSSSAPRYALFVFGWDAKTKVWAVFDKQPGSPEHTYDLLHIDMNANGDLTDEGEQFVAQPYEGTDTLVLFKTTPFKDPGNGKLHTDWVFVGPPVQESRQAWNSRLTWGGRHQMGVVYPPYGDSPRSAPVFWLDFQGPVEFRSWGGKPELSADKPLQWAFNIGVQGLGERSFATIGHHNLPDFPLNVELKYADQSGAQHVKRVELLERCCGDRFYGDVQLPPNTLPEAITAVVTAACPQESMFVTSGPLKVHSAGRSAGSSDNADSTISSRKVPPAKDVVPVSASLNEVHKWTPSGFYQ